MGGIIESDIISAVVPSKMTPRQVGTEFAKLVDAGVDLRPAGSARRAPYRLLSSGYTPKHKFRLFRTTFYLTHLRFDINFRFFVAYVVPDLPNPRTRRREAFPRIFYKDQSLVWRCATHLIRSESENWIGKGDLKVVVKDGVEMEYSAEETTDLPYEMQNALDVISRRSGRVQRDDRAVGLVLRKAPDGRFEPYNDFLAPRRRAGAEPRNLVNGGRYVASFSRENDPSSLRFAAGFEPDFRRGVLEVARSKSRMYGGAIRKFRILSTNRKIQYLFVAAPRQVWIIPPQTLTTELMTYGVRTIDVHADEDLFVPGYEYHFLDESEDPPRLLSQIPPGFAGEASEVDASRADASPWIEKLPVVRSFRRKLLS